MILAQTGQPFSAIFYGFATGKTVGATILDQANNVIVNRTTAGITEVDEVVNGITTVIYTAPTLGPVATAGSYVLAADDGTNVKPETLVVSPGAYIDRRQFEAAQALGDGGRSLITGNVVAGSTDAEAAIRAAADTNLQTQISAIGPSLLPGAAYLPLTANAAGNQWVQSAIIDAMVSDTAAIRSHKYLATQGPYVTGQSPVTVADKSNPVVLTDTSGGTLTVKAPSSITGTPMLILFDKTGSWASHTCTFDPNGKNLDNSASTVALTTANGVLAVHYDGTGWHTIIKR